MIEATLLHQVIVEVDAVLLESSAIAGETIMALAMVRMPYDEPDPPVTELQEVLGHVIRSVGITHRDPREPLEGSLRDTDAGDLAVEQELVEFLQV